MLALFAGAAFLTKMCYLSLAFNTLFVIVFLATLLLLRSRASQDSAFRSCCWDSSSWRCKSMHSETSFACTAGSFGPMQYDEFAHMAVQVLVSPIIVWLVSRLLDQFGYRLPLKLTAFFAGDDRVQLVGCLRDHRVVG